LLTTNSELNAIAPAAIIGLSKPAAAIGMDELVFENRAWEKAEHPRYVSKTLKMGENEERVFKVK